MVLMLDILGMAAWLTALATVIWLVKTGIETTTKFWLFLAVVIAILGTIGG